MEEVEGFVRTGVVFGNHLVSWGVALGAFLLVFLIGVQVRQILVRRLERRHDAPSRLMRAVAHALTRGTKRFFIFALAVGFAKQFLSLSIQADRFLDAFVLIALLVQIGLWASALVSLWIDNYLHNRDRPDPARSSAAQIIRITALFIVWSAVLLVGFSNFGVDITGLVAGLGVGGIAIAFALQSVLKDLFASLAIVLDKPFIVGDFIIFDEHLGTVERIGLKTTRLRSLSGEEISVANDALLNTRLRNFKRMEERRVVFNITCHHGVPLETLTAFPEHVRKTIEGLEGTRFDRSHLAEFSELGPRFESVYYVLSPDYNIYMDLHQQILLSIAAWFEEQGLEFAHPSRRLLFASGEGDGRVVPFASPLAQEPQRASR